MTDVIDDVLGLREGDELWALRRTRPAVTEHLQGAYDAVFDPASSTLGHLSLDERAAVALRVCTVAKVSQLAEHYLSRITDPALARAGKSGEADDPRLRAILSFATLVAGEPAASGQKEIDALQDAGLDRTAITTLSQVIAFTSFQLRVVAGLYMMGY